MGAPQAAQSRQSSYSTASYEEKTTLSPPSESPPHDNVRSINKYVLWAKVLWPLVLHACSSIAIATLMIHAIDHHSFNLDEHQPEVALADGTTIRSKRYAPLQSEITTLVSAALVVLRLIGAGWLRPLVWRCAFMLMEAPEGGLKPNQLQRMIGYGMPVLARKRGLAIWLVLAAVLPVRFVGPVLTGSITWAPYHEIMKQPATSTISVPAVKMIELETGPADFRELMSLRAVGRANIAWERGSHNDAMKRVLPSAAELEINSTLSSVTLPYFSVSQVDWIQDPEKTLAPDQLNLTGVVCPRISLSNGTCPIFELGTVALIPDALPNSNYTLVPSPSPVLETRLMIMAVARTGRDGRCISLPNLKPYPTTTPGFGYFCFAFARITYVAGVGVCTDCRLSSFSTVQNDTALEVLGDPLTREALILMPTVINTMVSMNQALFSSRTPADEQVIGLLSRSYGASWAALTDLIDYTPFNATYSAAFPSSQALVSLPRVYAWLAAQLLVTLSGAIFIYLQVQTQEPIVGDATLAAFYLDISDVITKHPKLREGPLRKIEYDGERLISRVDVNAR